jgi:spoIIIJ-associated protein
MTADLEFTGRNVNKAVEEAAKALKIPVEELHYEIVSHGSTGIFGLAGIKKARILVHHDAVARSRALTDPPDDEPQEKDAPETTTESDDHATAQTIGEAVLRRMVNAISPEAAIVVERDRTLLRFEIVGGQAGVLIGKRGQTLEAMQLLVEKAVRRIDGHHLRLLVDVEGYLAKKRAGLERNAHRVARTVAEKGTPGSLGYLSAQDRRTVHLALKEVQEVRTKSVGEGPLRKLMIYPRKKNTSRS